MKHFNTGRSARAAVGATLASIATSIIAMAVASGSTPIVPLGARTALWETCSPTSLAMASTRPQSPRP